MQPEWSIILNHPLINGKPATNTDRSIEAKPIVTSFDGFGMRRIFDVLSPTFRHTRISKRRSSCNIKLDLKKFYTLQFSNEGKLRIYHTFCK